MLSRHDSESSEPFAKSGPFDRCQSEGMKWIDLHIEKVGDDRQHPGHFRDAIQQENFLVLLGTPGSGKTSLLKQYQSENPVSSQFLTIRSFLRPTVKSGEDVTVLLLDGLDEFRCTSNQEKLSIITDVAEKLKALQITKVVLSCREMDWYGETDVVALKEVISNPVGIYRILPLTHDQRMAFADLFQIPEKEEFLERFVKIGFLENPQIFGMLASVYKKEPAFISRTKKDVFEHFIIHSRENNPVYKVNRVNELEPDQFCRLVGYIATCFFFCSCDELTSDFLEQISIKEEGYSKDDLEKALRTSLFSNGDFCHRTLAEFALGNFLAKHVGKRGISRLDRKNKSLFVRNGRIPTELRGSFAWLCSLSGRKDLIEVDPYYQAIHGDNSVFSPDQKKDIVLKVRDYAESNPYFYRMNHSMDLKGFYTPEMDEFLLSELSQSFSMRNHYFYFLSSIFTSSPSLSPRVRETIENLVVASQAPAFCKRALLPVFSDNPDFLKIVLSKIQKGEIEDTSDGLKEEILRILYPEFIGPEDIAPYLFLYGSRVGGYCHYLYKTPYSSKFDLVDRICCECRVQSPENSISIPENVKSFVSDYFLETCLYFEDPENPLSAENIFMILSHFRSYFGRYESLPFESYRYAITDKLKTHKATLERLSEALFSRYIDAGISSDLQEFSHFDFHSFFSLATPPDLAGILLSKLSLSLPHEINRNLLSIALSYTNREQFNPEDLRSKAVEFGLEKELNRWLFPSKPEWEKKREERNRAEEEKLRILLAENETYFAAKQDSDIQHRFGDLEFIADLFFFDEETESTKYVTPQTLERLKRVLRDSIRAPLHPELLTVQSLAESAPTACRNIDRMIYVACCLNSGPEMLLLEKAFSKYLYLISLVYERSINVIKGDYSETLETSDPSRAHQAVAEFLDCLLAQHLPEHKEILCRYTRSSFPASRNKQLVDLGGKEDSIKDGLIQNVMKVFNFQISGDDLEALSKVSVTEGTTQTILGLLAVARENKTSFSISQAVALHNLFEYEPGIFHDLTAERKTLLLDFMFDQFNTEELVAHVDGFQSQKDCCASFLRNDALVHLSLPELRRLQEIRSSQMDIWTYRITHTIAEREQAQADQQLGKFGPPEFKKVLFDDALPSDAAFFEEVVFRLEEYRDLLEANRNNDKEPFFDSNGKSKMERACRDEVFRFLERKYSSYFQVTREKLEAENQVDLNIKYSGNPSFEVQIECKKDDNEDIYSGLTNQLIGKYLSKNVRFGIYLVFYFGKKRDKHKLLTNLRSKIPEEFKTKITVLLFDLTKKPV